MNKNKNKKTFVVTFKRDDYDMEQLTYMKDAQLYTLAQGIEQATGDFAPLLPMDAWCDIIKNYTEEELCAYQDTYLHYIIHIPTEEA